MPRIIKIQKPSQIFGGDPVECFKERGLVDKIYLSYFNISFII